jgi:hypothetical protein
MLYTIEKADMKADIKKRLRKMIIISKRQPKTDISIKW